MVSNEGASLITQWPKLFASEARVQRDGSRQDLSSPHWDLCKCRVRVELLIHLIEGIHASDPTCKQL